MHIMIDLETLSTKTNASIIEIGAVAFDITNGNIDSEINVKIDPKEWSKNGRDVSGNTILWWMQQSKEASSRFKRGVSLETALNELDGFIRKYCYGKDVCVWGNGATFDITILQSAYEYFNMELPWSYRNVRDLRTIVALQPDIKEQTPFDGIQHRAVDDCKYQIKYLVNTLNVLCQK